MQLLQIVLSADKSFKQCFSPASTIVGNRLTLTMTLKLLPNPIMQFIPTDNMCKVLDGKSSLAFIRLTSPANGDLKYPTVGTGIAFTYLYNQPINVVYTFANIADYSKTLDATNGGFDILLDGEYSVAASVADVFHTLSNQTSCFSSTRLVASLAQNIFYFEVNPVYCQVASFTPYIEFNNNGKWNRVPIMPIETTNIYFTAADYSVGNSNFLTIQRYVIDMGSSPTEYAKYNDTSRSQVQIAMNLLLTDATTAFRLSLDYFVKTDIASISSVADYIFSLDVLGCLDQSQSRANMNNEILVFKTKYSQNLACMKQVPAVHPMYPALQNIINTLHHIKVKVLVSYDGIYHQQTEYYLPEQFFSLQYLQFKIEDKQFSSTAKAQIFVVLENNMNETLWVSSSLYVPIQFTCLIKQTTIFEDDKTCFQLWTNQSARCLANTGTKTLKYTGYLNNDDVYTKLITYQINSLVNYSLAVQTICMSCTNVIEDQDKCVENQNKMKSATNLKNDQFVLESTEEIQFIENAVLNTAQGVWTWVYVIGGCLFLFIGGGVIALTLSNRS
ncbi:Conserved_hypothetical protein [Hexamita inflata]|uniref:Transmembrane protein n=1 Tax=Hexamita inflata TaxID=28002 RepID=A0AA86VPD7_9EUKA|nr:Conserved hypothetical protein [Hexamita inflata]